LCLSESSEVEEGAQRPSRNRTQLELELALPALELPEVLAGELPLSEEPEVEAPDPDSDEELDEVVLAAGTVEDEPERESVR